MFLRRNRGHRRRPSAKKINWAHRPLLEQLETRVVPSLDFAGGFGGAGGTLAINGSAHVNGQVLQLTDGHNGEAGSAFSDVKQDITSFHSSFTFQLTDATADGFTFCIEGNAATALGPSGGGLGYGPDETGGTGGIANSVAVKFDLFNNQGEGSDSTGLFAGGAAPTNVGSVDLAPGGIDLHSGHIFRVGMTYDGTTLKVVILDAQTGASNSQNYTVNIPAKVGGSIAFVGFTGATGGLTATQDIVNWTYKEGPATPPLAPVVTAVGGPGHVVLTWTASSGASSYNIYRATTAGAEGSTPLQSGVNGTSFTDTSVVAGTTYFYEVTAVGIAGEGPRSAEVSATPTAGLDFSGGFAGAGSVLTTNGSAKISGDPVLELTDGHMGEAGSAFANVKQDITTFNTSFSFRLTDATADGFTFCIQGNAATALGPSGGGLGYGPDETGGTGGIANSVAVKFDLFNNQGEGIDSTGLYTNGVGPTNVGSVKLSASGIDLHSEHTFNVAMNYNATTLKVIIIDTNTGASNTQNYTVNIPTTVGGPTAFVGFTGATGGLTAKQDILNWTFGKVATATTVNSSPNPSVAGQVVTFTATVSPTGPAAVTPTGSVDFKEGGTDLTPGGVTLNGADQATFTTSTLAVGSHTITGIYSGDGNFQASTGDDSASPQVVNKASTSTTVSSAPNPSVFGQLVTVTATVAPVAPGAGTLTGVVAFTEGATTLASGVTVNGGVATFTTSSLAVGSHTITASYTLDPGFLDSTGNDSASPQIVNQASTTTAVSSTPNPSASGATVTFTATVAAVSPGAGTPSGTVTFTGGATTLAPGVTLNADVATFTTSSLALGSHTITASYGGDTSFLGSTGDDSASPQVIT